MSVDYALNVTLHFIDLIGELAIEADNILPEFRCFMIRANLKQSVLAIMRLSAFAGLHFTLLHHRCDKTDLLSQDAILLILCHIFALNKIDTGF